MFISYHSCCISHDYAPMIYCIYYCRVRMEKYLYGFLCIRENHILQNGEFVFILQSNRKPRTLFSPREQYVQNLKRETLMWIEELWLLGLVEKKKETKKAGNIMTLKIRGLCQVKRRNGCERYRKWNRPWPHARNEANIRAKKGIQQYGTSWVNKWLKSQREGGDKLRFSPKAPELYFPVFHHLSTRNHQKMLRLCSKW